jgi:CDP-4-dehydro-6-deoxyglucose reductase
MPHPPAEDLEFTVVARTRRTPTIVELELAPARQPLSYRPGQYVLLGDRDGAVPERSYSVANAPRASHRITLLVTRVPGGETSSWAHDRLDVGATVRVSGPYGTFVADPSGTRPVVCLAAGSGLAPIRALAEDAVHRRCGHAFTVLFSARGRGDVIDAPLFDGWHERHPALRLEVSLTRETGAGSTGSQAALEGRLPRQLPGLWPDLSGHDIFIAGAPGFVSACARTCRELGATPGHLHTEEFFAEPRPWKAPAPARAAS